MTASDRVYSAPIGGAEPRYFREVTRQVIDQPHPLYAVWEITLQCDLGCKHCGSRAGHARDGELTTAQCLDVVRQLAEVGIREVTLIGGEAYLREDWDLIAQEITSRGMACGMTTGARNLTPERIQRAVDAGLRSISISLDGLERTHDAQRGAKGSFKNALSAAENVAKTQIRLATNTQINRLSWPELPALAQLLADLGSKAWQIQLTVPMGRAADRPQLLLQPYELTSLYPLLVYLKDRILTPGGVTLYPGNNIGYFGPYESLLRYGGEKGAHWGGCPAGRFSIGLEADGKIKACPSLPSATYSGGKTTEMTVAEAVARTVQVGFIRQRTRSDLWGFCQTCQYADICQAGCTWTSQVFLGRPGNNPYCIHRALEQEKLGRREYFVPVSQAPGVPFDQGRFVLKEAPLLPLSEPTLSGRPVADCLALNWRSGGIWDPEQLSTLLTPIKTGRLQVLHD